MLNRQVTIKNVTYYNLDGVQSITLSLSSKTVSASPTVTFTLNTGTSIASGDCKFHFSSNFSFRHQICGDQPL